VYCEFQNEANQYSISATIDLAIK